MPKFRVDLFTISFISSNVSLELILTWQLNIVSFFTYVKLIADLPMSNQLKLSPWALSAFCNCFQLLSDNTNNKWILDQQVKIGKGLTVWKT